MTNRFDWIKSVNARKPYPTTTHQATIGRGMGITAAEQEAELARVRSIMSNIQASAEVNYQEWKPALDAAGALVRDVAGQDLASLPLDVFNTALSALAMAGPYGAAIAGVLKAITGLLMWLAKEYPATAVDCLPGLASGVAGGEANAARVYRDEGRLFIGTVLNRGSRTADFKVGLNGENLFWQDPCGGSEYMHIPGDGMPNKGIPRLDVGTQEAKKAELWKALAPMRAFAVPTPPVWSGYRSWGEYLRNNPDEQGAVAAIRIGQESAAKLARDGDLLFVDNGFTSAGGYDRSATTCKAVGYLYKISALPNESLLNVLRWVCTQTTAGQEAAAAEKIVLAPPQSGNITDAVMYWYDGFTRAAIFFLRRSPDRYMPYHANALIKEYQARKSAGKIAPRFVLHSPGSKTTLLKFIRPSAPMSTGAKVAVAAGGVGILAGLAKLLKLW